MTEILAEKAVLSDLKTAFTFTPALSCECFELHPGAVDSHIKRSGGEGAGGGARRLT